MIKKLIICIIALTLPFIVLNSSWAQELEMEYEFSYGVLLSKTSNQITISEFNYDTEEEDAVTYMLNGDTEFEDMDGLDDLQIGDEVEILYVIEDGSRVATVVSKSVEEDLEPVTFLDLGETIIS